MNSTLKLTRSLLVALLLVPGALAISAPAPEVIGTWLGAGIGKKTDAATGISSPYKGDVTLTINADNSFSFYYADTMLGYPTGGVFGSRVGTLNVGAPLVRVNSTIHFNGDTLRGDVQIVQFDRGGEEIVSITEAKFKARKQP